jgi:hypothetical protein
MKNFHHDGKREKLIELLQFQTTRQNFKNPTKFWFFFGKSDGKFGGTLILQSIKISVQN